MYLTAYLSSRCHNVITRAALRVSPVHVDHNLRLQTPPRRVSMDAWAQGNLTILSLFVKMPASRMDSPFASSLMGTVTAVSQYDQHESIMKQLQGQRYDKIDPGVAIREVDLYLARPSTPVVTSICLLTTALQPQSNG